jgi:cyclophilin family peptidyl-prolyl cis-trans isomerase
MKKLISRSLIALGILAVANLPVAGADISVVLIETNYGDITLELYPENAPITVENFLNYVEQGFYEDLIFHRVIDDFMIQGGAFDGDLYDFLDDPNFSDPNWARDPLFYHEPNDPIVNESSNGLSNVRGTIAMARTSDPDSATSQFFINQVDNLFLDPTGTNNGYTVFGRVIAGMEVVDAIAQAPTHLAVIDTFEDLPNEPAVIESVVLLITFDPNSSDFSMVDFLRADEETTRTFVGQDSYTGQRYAHTFDKETVLKVECLRWEQAAEPNANIDDFNILLARDDTDSIWVFQYEVNGTTVIDANSLANIAPLSDLSDQMCFRLLLGAYNPDNISDPQNTVTRDEQGDTVTEQIISFAEELENLPFFGDELILVKQTRQSDANDIRWRYYDKSTGQVLEIHDVSGDVNADGWRLGWYGRNKPQFEGNSADLRSVPFINAETGDWRVYQWQGSGEGNDFQQIYTQMNHLGVKCLKIDETFSTWIEPEKTLLLAKDTNGGLWLFEELIYLTGFRAGSIDQIVPLDMAQDMHLLLMSGAQVEPGAIVSTGTDPNQQIEEVFSTNSSLDRFPDFANELILVKTSQGADPQPVAWSYYHESIGLVQEVGPNILDPNVPDPNSDGWYLQEPEQMEDVALTIQASRERQTPSDAFKVWGRFGATTQDIESGALEIRVGTYRIVINPESEDFSRTTPVPGKYIFKGSSDGVERIIVIINLNRNKFLISAQDVDLTGLSGPVKVELRAGNYFGGSLAEIKGNKSVPAQLMRGQMDMLHKTSYRFAYDNSLNSFQTYSLTVNGDITTDVYPLNLTGREITVRWGARVFTIPEGEDGLRRSGKREKFVYRSSEGMLRMAIFDMENCTFKILLNKGFLSKPAQNLSITFAKDEDRNFEQSTPIP